MRVSPVYICLLVLSSCGWFEEASSIHFVDEADERGLSFIYLAGGTEKYRLPEIMGGGVALLDADADGDLDVYLLQSGSLDYQPAEHSNELFVNDGTGHFTRAEAGDASRNLGFSMGVAAGDMNNDSLPDLFVTQLGRNVLLRNEGKNRFKDISLDAGFRFEDWSTATAFADFDADGDLDLWVVNYIEWSQAMEPECYQSMLGSRDYCSPSHYDAPAQDRVFRNEGDGTFTDISASAGVMGTKGNGLGIVTADFNADGLIDVFVANDSSPNHLWLNGGNFQFTEECTVWNCAVDQHGVARAGMGVIATDLNGDQAQDLIVVNITTQPNYVFQNSGDYFRDVTPKVGLSTFTQRFTRFGLVVEDFDNDGMIDLYEANGAVARLATPHRGDKYAEPNSLYRGVRGDKFEFLEHTDLVSTSRGAAVGDLDNNGSLEIVLIDRDESAKLLVNQSTSRGYWLVLDVREQSGRFALGATVSLDIGNRKVTRTVQHASSYLSSRDPRLHFGLGEIHGVENVRVKWLDGEERDIDWMEANQIVTVSKRGE